MISLTLDDKIDVLPDEIEKQILNLVDKKAPNCYSQMSNTEIKFLKDNFINDLKFKKYNINLEQIQSIRSSYIKNKMIKKHSYLIAKSKNIIRYYQKVIQKKKLKNYLIILNY
jgi:hypothetical protein